MEEVICREREMTLMGMEMREQEGNDEGKDENEIFCVALIDK